MYHVNNRDIHKVVNVDILGGHIQMFKKMLDNASRHANESSCKMADLDKERSWHVFAGPREITRRKFSFHYMTSSTSSSKDDQLIN